MQYLILIYDKPERIDRTQAEWDDLYPKYVAYGDKLRASGAFVSAAPLAPPSSATTIRVQDGKNTMIDGPFAETKEWLAGYYLVNAATLDEALGYANECPGLLHGSAIEVRPLLDIG